MKILNYETFLETMQFAVLKNAQNLAKQEEERRKSKQQAEENSQVSKKPVDDISGEGQKEMETEGEVPEMETEGEIPEMETEGEVPEMEP